MEEEEIDIYGDLDDFDANEKLHKKNVEFEEVKGKLEQVTGEKEKLKTELEQLRKEYEQVMLNYSSFLLTAKSEVKRKDGKIDEIRKQLDNVCFRRKNIKQKAVPKRDIGTQTDKDKDQPYTNSFRKANGQHTNAQEKIGRIEENGKKLNPFSGGQKDIDAKKNHNDELQYNSLRKSARNMKSDGARDNKNNERDRERERDKVEAEGRANRKRRRTPSRERYRNNSRDRKKFRRSRSHSRSPNRNDQNSAKTRNSAQTNHRHKDRKTPEKRLRREESPTKLNGIADARQLIENKRNRAGETHASKSRRISTGDKTEVRASKCDSEAKADKYSPSKSRSGSESSHRHPRDDAMKNVKVGHKMRSGKIDTKSDCPELFNDNNENSVDVEEGEIVEKPASNERHSRALRSRRTIVRKTSQDMLRTCVPIPMSPDKLERSIGIRKAFKLQKSSEEIKLPIENRLASPQSPEVVKMDVEENANSNIGNHPDFKQEEQKSSTASETMVDLKQEVPKVQTEIVPIQNPERKVSETQTKVMPQPVIPTNTSPVEVKEEQLATVKIEEEKVEDSLVSPENRNSLEIGSPKKVEDPKPATPEKSSLEENRSDSITENAKLEEDVLYSPVKLEMSIDKTEGQLNESQTKSIKNISTTTTDYKFVEDDTEEVTIILTRKRRKKKKHPPKADVSS